METETSDNALNETKPCACWGCGEHITAEDNYCRKCGKGQGRFIPWYYKHFGIVFLTFCAGPFSLYFAWRSPILSRTAKWIYTGLIALAVCYVASVLYRLWMFFQPMFGGIQV